ncbi:MAG: dienelactone hydrolase family protein [Candidatus Moranbacteria bacterium]|nr:dienelactone hydrolase family protein [Candidatus Moranbacteria bacterium]
MLNHEQQTIQIPINSISVEGILTVPKNHTGSLVIFVHGSGSSRNSPRNDYVSKCLNKAGLSTLLFDLLTEKEDEIYENRFDIPLLVERIKVATTWVKNHPELKDFSVGYFGASTGAATAIEAAADADLGIKAVVSRGGRPDLAENYLSKISSPTLLIVGGNDDAVIDLNKSAFEKISAKKELSIVPGATHLFEEPGALEKVCELSSSWFQKYLT